MRHNKLRDLEAELLREVCQDVRIEPALLPIVNENLLAATTNQTENARLDVSAIGVYGPQEKTFLDIRVMHPNCPSYVNKSVTKVYEEHEKAKKREYNERVIQVEKGSFTPIVFSTFGGMGKETERYHRRLAQLVANKRGETYSSVMNFIRTRLRFCLLRSVLTSIRGVRDKRAARGYTAPISSLSFNLIEVNE